jgi:prepilin-type N-terminal cleavage/methylation domain-containing protein
MNVKFSQVCVRKNGFSLIELMIVLVIIGILAAILIPNLLDATHRAKQRASIGELRSWAIGVSAYMAERGIVPPLITAAGIPVSTIHGDLVPYAVSSLHDQDAWKHDMLAYSSDPISYTLVSRGRDGLPSPCITPATARNWDEDLAVSDGLFICSPS